MKLNFFLTMIRKGIKPDVTIYGILLRVLFLKCMIS